MGNFMMVAYFGMVDFPLGVQNLFRILPLSVHIPQNFQHLVAAKLLIQSEEVTNVQNSYTDVVCHPGQYGEARSLQAV